MINHDEVDRVFDRLNVERTSHVKQTHAERIFSDLRASILLGELRPGNVIIEPALAKDYGSSKTPAREALRRLMEGGMVTVLPRKGYVVSSFGLEDLLDVYSLRALVQPPLASGAAQRRRAAHLADLEEAVERVRVASSFPAAMLAGAEAQIITAQAAGSPRAARLVRDLLFESTRFMLTVPPPPEEEAADMGLAVVEITELADAIAAQDSEAALRVTADYIEARRRIMAERMMAGSLGRRLPDSDATGGATEAPHRYRVERQ